MIVSFIAGTFIGSLIGVSLMALAEIAWRSRDE